MRFAPILAIVCVGLAGCGASPPKQELSQPPVVAWKAAVATEPVPDDPDDPGIWIDPADPSRSVIIGTNKVAEPNGALVVFDLNGKILQTVRGLDRPNNVDLRQGVSLGGRKLDIVATTERNHGTLRFYEVDAASRTLKEMARLPVFEGEQGDMARPMGVAFYHRPSDGGLYVMVGRKTGPADGYLWQYKVEPGPRLQLVRKFGKFSLKGEIEAVVVDDALGKVFYADEGAGIRQYAADPDVVRASEEVALFGTEGYNGDREGLAIYTTGPRAGYLISTDQLPNGSRYFVYDRERPREPLAVIEGRADETDGIEATSAALGPAFPNGLLVTMNSGPKNFLLFPWKPLPR